MMKLSIIIPVYNIEKYVAKCIDSCLKQDIAHDEYEIIVIDDGSNDSSLKIVNDIALYYNNIVVLSQENQGQSVARNRGLKVAKGEYIWFVDSDDSIEQNCLGKVLAEGWDMDMLAFGGKDFTEDGEEVKRYSYKLSPTVMSGLEFIIKSCMNFSHGVPFYIFRRNFLLDNNLEFYCGIYHEDSEFTPRALSMAKRIAVSSESYYHRNLRIGSITRSVITKKAYDLVIVAERLNDFIIRSNFTAAEKNTMLGLVPMMLNGSLSVILDDTKHQRAKFNMFFSKKFLYKYYLASTNPKYFIEGLLFSVFRKHSVELYKLLKR